MSKDHSAVEYVGRVNGMYEPDENGSYALFRFVGSSGQDATQIRVSEQQAVDLARHVKAAWPGVFQSVAAESK